MAWVGQEGPLDQQTLIPEPGEELLAVAKVAFIFILRVCEEASHPTPFCHRASVPFCVVEQNADAAFTGGGKSLIFLFLIKNYIRAP